jgi:TonB family protein
MKRLFYFSSSLIISINTPAISQEKGSDFFTITEGMPQYPGGDAALLKYISEEVLYPEECKKNGIMGIVFVSYVVSRVGGIEDVEVVRSSNELFNQEALRVVKSLTGYKPARQRGKTVPCQFTIPIKFVLTNADAESQAEGAKAIAIAYYNLGAQEFALKNYYVAESLFGQALKNTSNWFYQPFLARGKTYIITNKYDQALADFKSVLKIKPQLFDAHLEKGKTYLLQNDKSNAIKSLKKSLKIDSTSVDVLQYLGELHYSNFEYDLALGYYERLVALDQTQGIIYYYLGICYAKKRDVSHSCEHMSSAFNLGIKDAGLFVQNFCTGK